MSNRFGRMAVGAAIAVSLLGNAAMAEDMWVKSASVDIRSGKGAVYPILATVKAGTKLNVLSHDGKWLVVAVGDQQGYVFQDALSDHRMAGAGNVLANLTPSNDASSLSTSAAAKGLSEEANTYAAQKNLDPALMNKLIDFRKTIDPKDWEKFVADGKVGPEAPAAQ